MIDMEVIKLDYTESMKFINKYTKSGGRVKDLSRAQRLMQQLGNPQNTLRFVHIAGTNGKGSVLELTSQSLINAGYKTGQFTSPFIKCYEDRIRINGNNISHDDIAQLCTKVSESAGDDEYSQFEITMAIALLYFAKEKCDIVFMETGIGGIFDCTNIIENPLVSVITSVSLDHTAILGKTVQEIAIQKAGIIKRDRPAVVSWNNTSVINIFQKECILKNSTLIIPDQSEFEECSSDESGGSFIYNEEKYYIKMHGSHQIINAATAIKTIEVLRNEGFNISSDNVREAFSTVQVLSRVEVIHGDPEIIIDGGHNPAGVSAMISTLISMNIKNPVLIFGMVDTKDIETSSELLSTFAHSVICVDGFASNAIDRTTLAGYFKGKSYVAETDEAFYLAKRIAKKNNSAIVICGSLYLTETFRKFIGN